MQFSLFGAAAAEPLPEDLDGVLLAGGQWVRSTTGARLSVVVAEPWRARAIAAAFTERGYGAEIVEATAGDEQGLAVRTDFTVELLESASRWTRGANQAPPNGFVLTAGGLRLWAISAGRSETAGYLLGTAEPDDAIHLAAGAQLARLGLTAVSITTGAGPGWRITSLKRLRRLAELLGEPPEGAAAQWPIELPPAFGGGR